MPTVASGPSSALASSGALIAGHIANFTSSLVNQLPPSVQTSIDSASQYIEATTGVTPTFFYSSAAAAAILLGAIPTAYAKSKSNSNNKQGGKKMSRRGWSSHERGGLSPYTSSLGDGRGGIPEVTDEDYSYITSEDLEGTNDVGDGRYGRAPPGQYNSRAGGGPALVIDDDDILLIKHKGVTYPEHFPAYSIGDGKLLVGDVRERVQMIMKLSDRRTRKIKLLYKGRQLKNDDDPVRSFNVKNNSEILIVLPESGDDDSSSDSEEVVVVGRDDEGRSGKKKNKKRKTKKKGGRSSSTSPRESNSNLEVPGAGGAGGSSRPTSPASGVSGASAAPGGPLDKLNTISSHFTTKLLPLCVQFTASPPSDRKKREDEHRKISETIMQQVLLKLDEVETNGEEEARARRKELVRTVQDVLKGLDNKLNE